VGSSTSAYEDHAFVWKKQTGIVDLNNTVPTDLGIVLVEAHAINRKGQIIAMGKIAHGIMASEDQVCAPAPPLSFLLTPIASP
jgi:short-subunit dehydrogenase